MTRQILTLRDPTTLSNGDVLLYHPYKNLVSNFYQLATDFLFHQLSLTLSPPFTLPTEITYDIIGSKNS